MRKEERKRGRCRAARAGMINKIATQFGPLYEQTLCFIRGANDKRNEPNFSRADTMLHRNSGVNDKMRATHITWVTMSPALVLHRGKSAVV